MNVLELKLAFDDALAGINEHEGEIKDKELVALVDNDVRNGNPLKERFEQADLVFDSVGVGKLPTGASFVLIECIKRPNQNVSLEGVMGSLDEVLDIVPLNAPVIFQYQGEMILLWCICATICTDDHQKFARILIQFADKKFPGYRKQCANIMESMGFSSQGNQKRYRLF